MKKPVIGIIPLIDYARESYWMLPGYMNGLIEAGAAPLMLPLTEDQEMLEQLLGLCDGLLLTGGQDVSPVLYGEKEKKWCGECSPERDRMELVLLDLALQQDMPVLGICRGLQFLNAALGGTLYQDLKTERGVDSEHQVLNPPYNTPAHQVYIKRDSPLWNLLEGSEGVTMLAPGENPQDPYVPVTVTKKNSSAAENAADGAAENAAAAGNKGAAVAAGNKAEERLAMAIGVNSLHHQGIRDLAPCLERMAWAEDGLTEAIRHPGKSFVWAVQWHPEFLYKVDENSRRIFRAFTGAACDYAAG